MSHLLHANSSQLSINIFKFALLLASPDGPVVVAVYRRHFFRFVRPLAALHRRVEPSNIIRPTDTSACHQRISCCAWRISWYVAFQFAPTHFSLEPAPKIAADHSDDYTGSGESGQSKPVMVGFARLISDSARFAFLADFYILPSHRHLGLGKALLKCINDHPANRVYRQITRLPPGNLENENRNALRGLLECSGYKLASPMDSRGIYTMHRVWSLSVDINEENRCPREWRSDKWPHYFASTDKDLLQLEVIHRYLSEESYWAKGVSLETVKLRMDGSFCIGLYERKLDGA